MCVCVCVLTRLYIPACLYGLNFPPLCFANCTPPTTPQRALRERAAAASASPAAVVERQRHAGNATAAVQDARGTAFLARLRLRGNKGKGVCVYVNVCVSVFCAGAQSIH